MILFDLKCSFDHIFEAWFKDSNEFNKQRKTKLITCPVCEDTQITKSLMTPNVGKKSNALKSKKTLNYCNDFEVLPDEINEVWRALRDHQDL